MTNTSKINYTVQVDISASPAAYSYKDAEGNTSDGSPTVTEKNSEIIYTLETAGLIFVEPQISDDPGGDLSWDISGDKRTLTVSDTDEDEEDACLVLVVAEASNPSVHYPSPDPKIRNKPST